MLYRKERSPSRILNKLIFIDSAVNDSKALIKGISSDSQVLILDPDQDGVEKITTVLQKYSAEEVHIVSHGSPGSLRLGNVYLSLSTLNDYCTHLKTWSNAFSSAIADPFRKGAFYLYGCRVAAGCAVFRIYRSVSSAYKLKCCSFYELYWQQHSKRRLEPGVYPRGRFPPLSLSQRKRKNLIASSFQTLLILTISMTIL